MYSCVSICGLFAVKKTSLYYKERYLSGVHEWEKLFFHQNSFFAVFFGRADEDNVTKRFRAHIPGISHGLTHDAKNIKFQREPKNKRIQDHKKACRTLSHPFAGRKIVKFLSRVQL